MIASETHFYLPDRPPGLVRIRLSNVTSQITPSAKFCEFPERSGEDGGAAPFLQTYPRPRVSAPLKIPPRESPFQIRTRSTRD
ncbi:MAG: hypothetical protein OXH47_10075 [Paracoccaceae bacterium]|nr:hypothetical protein [Paracoccaceae bacterium]